MTSNQIAYWNMIMQKTHNERADQEANRSNLAKELENYRHNVQQEALTASDVFGNLQVSRARAAEDARAHMAQEAELNRSHLAQEAEMYRANTMKEETEFGRVANQLMDTISTKGTLNPVGTAAGAVIAATLMPRHTAQEGQFYKDEIMSSIQSIIKPSKARSGVPSNKKLQFGTY